MFRFKLLTVLSVCVSLRLSVQSDESVILSESLWFHIWNVRCVAWCLPTSWTAAPAQLDVVRGGACIERAAARASDLLWFLWERSEVSCFIPYKQPHVSNSPLSLHRFHTHTHTHTPYTQTQPHLFQADTITDLASASVPYLKLINAASDMGGHQEIFLPFMSSPTPPPPRPTRTSPPVSFFLSPENMINGIYFEIWTSRKYGPCARLSAVLTHICVTHYEFVCVCVWGGGGWNKLLSNGAFF